MGAQAVGEAGILDRIKSRFGSRDAAIERAFEENASFRALCTDYVSCAKALKHWQESDADDARFRETEYTRLLAQLTQEIEKCVSAMDR